MHQIRNQFQSRHYKKIHCFIQTQKSRWSNIDQLYLFPFHLSKKLTWHLFLQKVKSNIQHYVKDIKRELLLKSQSADLVTKESGWDWNKAWWEWRAAWWNGEGGDKREACREAKGSGRDRRGGVDCLPEELVGWEEEEEEEEDEEEEGLESRGKWWWRSGLVVSDSGWACSEWVGAGAAGEARATEGVAGESSMLPWDEAGLSIIFSWGRYCTHGFLFRAEKSERRQKSRNINGEDF